MFNLLDIGALAHFSLICAGKLERVSNCRSQTDRVQKIEKSRKVCVFAQAEPAGNAIDAVHVTI